VFSTLRLRIRARVTRAVARAKRLLRETLRPLPLVAGALEDLTRSRGELIAENALLRQQLIVASGKVKRPAFRAHERGLLVVLSHIVRGWRDALLLFKPETILRWHREGFRLFWRWKSRRPKPVEPKISYDVMSSGRTRLAISTRPDHTKGSVNESRLQRRPISTPRAPRCGRFQSWPGATMTTR
jgi:hypothetical protein